MCIIGITCVCLDEGRGLWLSECKSSQKSIKIRWLGAGINKYDINYTSLWFSPLPSPHSSPKSSWLLFYVFTMMQQAEYKIFSLAVGGNSTTLFQQMHGLLWRHKVEEKKNLWTPKLIILHPCWKTCSGYILFLQYSLEQKKQRILHTERRKNY